MGPIDVAETAGKMCHYYISSLTLFTYDRITNVGVVPGVIVADVEICSG
jgi:hypothetical protein